MSKNELIEWLEQKQLKQDVPDFCVGDTIRVHVRITEAGGKERVQMFAGTCIARNGGGLSETVSVHRVAYGEGMERVFFLNSPLVVKIEVARQGHVRRAKLSYLRGTSGKASKVRGRYGMQKSQDQEVSQEAQAEAAL
jgi:large subunit ribosomal protein L19